MAQPHALVLEHLDLVPRLARKLQISPDSSVWDDAIQAGRMALIEAAAVGRYDPTRGTSFREYASGYVLGALKDALSAEPLISPTRRASLEAIERSRAVVLVELEAADPREARWLSSRQSLPRQLVDTDVEDRMAEELDTKRRAEEVRAAVRELPEKPSRAAAAVLSELMTPAQFADARGISLRSVFSHLGLARSALTEWLRDDDSYDGEH